MITKKMFIYNFLLLSFIFSSCNDWQGQPSVSDDISDSKKRGIFICEYEANPNPIKINDSLIFDIETAWLERRWKHSEKYEDTDPMEGYQLVILTKDNIHKGIGTAWTIGIDFDRYVRSCGRACLITNFKKLPISNKEIWKVQKGRNLKNDDEKIILGEFILYKKTNEN